MTKNTAEFDALIIGSGIVGSLLALRLAKAGLSSALLADRGQNPKPLTAPLMYALSPAQRPLLEQTDIWQDIFPQSRPIDEMVITMGTETQGPYPSRLHLKSADLEGGALAYSVEDSTLRSTIKAKINTQKQKDISHFLPKIKAIERAPASVHVTLEDGDALSAPLLVIADGRARKYASDLGFVYTQKSYFQRAIIARIAHECPHDNVAHQIFTPTGPLAILPMPRKGAETASAIVWSLPKRRAKLLKSASESDFIAALHPLFGDFRKGIALTSGREDFALEHIGVDRIGADRVALIGDGAHIVHPLAGQGLNLGLGDAAALGAVIVESARRGEDIGAPDILERFCAHRRSDILAVGTLTQAMHQVFCAPPPIRQALNIAIGALDKSPFGSHLVARYAAQVMGAHHITRG